MSLSIFWFRRDLRLEDNAGLYHALKNSGQVLPVFIFDKNILDRLEDKDDARVGFIYQRVLELKKELETIGSTMLIFYGSPDEAFGKLVKHLPELQAVYTNHDYEPYARERDREITAMLRKKNISFHSYKDQCIFEKEEVLKDDGKPYTVFTAYKNKWMKKLGDFHLKSYLCEPYFSSLARMADQYMTISSSPTLETLGFRKNDHIIFPPAEYKSILKDYKEKRDIPSEKGTSRISIHLRFGTVSIRELAREGREQSESWLNELIWRDFYFQILWHFPHVAKNAFRPEYDKIRWRNNEDEFKRWCEGQTGYPIVDAGMRELNATGFMHNRVRMIVASFLTKHLLIDWRWGEAYFARKLLDFELASNNGGWQWAAGTGCDAAPYFRIFNPYEQTRKFDPGYLYISKWVPEYKELTYPLPVIEHAAARERCLKVYRQALANPPQ